MQHKKKITARLAAFGFTLFLLTAGSAAFAQQLFKYGTLMVMEKIAGINEPPKIKEALTGDNWELKENGKVKSGETYNFFVKASWSDITVYYTTADRVLLVAAGVSYQFLYNELRDEMSGKGFTLLRTETVKDDAGKEWDKKTYAKKGYPYQVMGDWSKRTVYLLTDQSAGFIK